MTNFSFLRGPYLPKVLCVEWVSMGTPSIIAYLLVLSLFKSSLDNHIVEVPSTGVAPVSFLVDTIS